MPIISQGLTLPGNVQTGGTIQAADVATLYQTMNAFNIPGTIGTLQQGFVDDNKYTIAASGSQDWTFTTVYNKAVICLIPFTWTGSTAVVALTPRQTGAAASTGFMSFTNASSGDGLILGLVGPRSTDVTAPAFWLGMDNRTPGTLRTLAASTGGFSTTDMASLGFQTSSTGALAVTFHSVRFWQEG